MILVDPMSPYEYALWTRKQAPPSCAFRETQTDKPSIADTVFGHGDVRIATLGIVAGTIVDEAP